MDEEIVDRLEAHRMAVVALAAVLGKEADDMDRIITALARMQGAIATSEFRSPAFHDEVGALLALLRAYTEPPSPRAEH